MKTDRRSFLKKTATAAVGIGLVSSANAMTAKSYKNIIGANDRLNLAIQGLGRRYFSFIEGIAAKESNVRLKYLCDVMPSQLDKAQEKVSKKIDYKIKSEIDIRNIINDKDIDAIFMATPDHWHTPGAIMAMQ
ncbi:MAG: twin-arginine translocation signal domain-containing protein, partial [Polaribacter sp.]